MTKLESYPKAAPASLVAHKLGLQRKGIDSIRLIQTQSQGHQKLDITITGGIGLEGKRGKADALVQFR
jgi:hypothetical protein